MFMQTVSQLGPQLASQLAPQAVADPHSAWTTVVQVSAAALSPIVAIAAVWIARQQVRINRNKLKLDRFDKRFAIHEAAMSFTASAIASGAPSVERLNQFLVETRGARFLVSKEIADYLRELYDNGNKLRAITFNLQVFTYSEDQRKAWGEKWREHTEWIQAQLDVIPEKFAPYLSVEDI